MSTVSASTSNPHLHLDYSLKSVEDSRAIESFIAEGELYECPPMMINARLKCLRNSV
jgi:hypothetical protein